jgi:hypothetical protein
MGNNLGKVHSRSNWFFVVGAQKAGTSTLHNWLSQNPEISLPKRKETHFFRDEEKFNRGLKWYLRQFRNKQDGRLFGEVNPEYLFFEESLKRIGDCFPAPKIVIVVREPLSRAYSHYLMSVRRGHEALSFKEALLHEKERLQNGGRFSMIHHSYISRGLYGAQIARMRAILPESKVHSLFFEDLFSSQEQAVAQVALLCEFLGVEAPTRSPSINRKANQASEPRLIGLRNLIHGDGLIKKIAGKIIPSRRLKITIVRLLDSLNQRPILGDLGGEEIPEFVYERLSEDLSYMSNGLRARAKIWRAAE